MTVSESRGMRNQGHKYLEPLSHLPLLPVLLRSCTSHLFLELSLAYSTVVLEIEHAARLSCYETRSEKGIELRHGLVISMEKI